VSSLLHLADRVLNRPLLITPEKLAVIASVLEGRIGIDASDLRSIPDASRFAGSSTDHDPATGSRVGLPYKRTSEGVAILPVLGSLVNRGAWVGASSGLTSYEGLKYQLSQAAADPKTRSVLIDLDSPGGEAVGAFEAAEAVRAVAARKPVVAVVNGMAASAAYAIASGATRIITTPSGLSGSIGVVMLHADISGAMSKAGIKPTLIYAGARKVDGNPYGPLSAEVKASIQAEIDGFYDAFIATVAAGRPKLSAGAIRATEARVFIGEAAVRAGLADAIGTFESALADLAAGRIAGAGSLSSPVAALPPRAVGATPARPIPQQATPPSVESSWEDAVTKVNSEMSRNNPRHKSPRKF
jgi:signal peptide peptidase SppA